MPPDKRQNPCLNGKGRGWNPGREAKITQQCLLDRMLASVEHGLLPIPEHLAVGLSQIIYPRLKGLDPIGRSDGDKISHIDGYENRHGNGSHFDKQSPFSEDHEQHQREQCPLRLGSDQYRKERTRPHGFLINQR